MRSADKNRQVCQGTALTKWWRLSTKSEAFGHCMSELDAFTSASTISLFGDPVRDNQYELTRDPSRGKIQTYP